MDEAQKGDGLPSRDVSVPPPAEELSPAAIVPPRVWNEQHRVYFLSFKELSAKRDAWIQVPAAILI